ncbi:unnamed protein product [Blepharisma stoltei]|uniref:Enoyl reductase (ER) domain-containing protein n=1 Tax=Blepharisma stoltei TaxID=1481888 RepID=A0AAU9JWM3_9CILI|nr:unnamed protein product [Blepharisma stoltei]
MAEKIKLASIEKYTDLGTIQIKEIDVPSLPEGYVLIKTEFASINPSDEIVAMGCSHFHLSNSSLGLQGSGTVMQSGGGALANSLVNKRVAFLVSGQNSIGSFSEYSITKAEKVLPINDDFSFENAANVFTAFTVEYMMKKIKKGNHRAVIQTAAASSVGKALLRYCHYYGIPVINLVRRNDQAEVLRDIGADYIIITTSEGWQNRTRLLVKELGATIGFDAISGEMAGEVYDLIKEPGKLYIYGNLSGQFCMINPTSLARKKIIRGLDLNIWLTKLTILKKMDIFDKVQKLYDQIFRIDYKETINLNKLKNALISYRERKTNSKILVRTRFD